MRKRLLQSYQTVLAVRPTVKIGCEHETTKSESGTTEGETVVETIRENDGTAIFVRADMRKPADIENIVATTVEEYDEITTVVNNAAVKTKTTASTATLDDWQFVLETDFRAYWLTVNHSLEHIPEGGSIVNISSNHAFLTTPGIFPYNAVKAGINGMTRAFAVEFGPLGIRANTVNPGWIEVARTREELGRVPHCFRGIRMTCG